VIFRYQYLKVYRNSINKKSWVKDVIQGFAQKAVKFPRNSRQNFRNSREFPPGILGVRNSREFPSIPEREFPVALLDFL